jgi:hypothetical protein
MDHILAATVTRDEVVPHSMTKRTGRKRSIVPTLVVACSVSSVQVNEATPPRHQRVARAVVLPNGGRAQLIA